MENIILHVYYTGEKENLQAFVKEMQEGGLQAGVKSEDGCGQYDYFFPADGGSYVVLLENWRDAEALQTHMDQPRMAEIRALKDKLGLTTRIERYE